MAFRGHFFGLKNGIVLSIKQSFFICWFIFFAPASQGAEFDLGTHGTLSVSVPDGWSVNGKAANRPDGTSIGYAFAIKPRSDANAKCLLTFAYTTNGAPNKEVIRKEVLRTCEEFVSESVEKKKNLRDFSLEKGYGVYSFDWQFINYYFHRFLGRNPFGFSGRRIGDLYAGLVKDVSKATEWKKYRVTAHRHNPSPPDRDDPRGWLTDQRRMRANCSRN